MRLRTASSIDVPWAAVAITRPYPNPLLREGGSHRREAVDMHSHPRDCSHSSHHSNHYPHSNPQG